MGEIIINEQQQQQEQQPISYDYTRVARRLGARGSGDQPLSSHLDVQPATPTEGVGRAHVAVPRCPVAVELVLGRLAQPGR